MRTVPKALRHRRILDLIGRESILTQEDLVDRLARAGLTVTQATLSRDLKELGLVKTAGGYSTPAEVGGQPSAPAPSLSHLLREFVVGIKEAQNLLVLRTTAGSAQPVAAALDAEKWPELLGTLAGDDTILVVTSSGKHSRALGKRIRELMQ
jgi:transcriptional regulator of arginine metabolism